MLRNAARHGSWSDDMFSKRRFSSKPFKGFAMKPILITSTALVLILGFGQARAGDDVKPREPVTITVKIPEADSIGIPILTVPAGKRFVGQAVNCYNAGAPRISGAQCLLQANLSSGNLIELPLPPLTYDNFTVMPTVTQNMPFYLGPGTVLLGYCFVTAPLQITVSGYFVKDKD
jgi:hypothetical protein